MILLNCGTGEDSWESLWCQEDQSNQSWRKSTLNIHWKGWCWCWSSNNLATWCKELTHWKRPWDWERLRTAGEGGNRGWDGWMASLIQWTWTWANSERLWGTWMRGMLQSMGSQKLGHNLVIEQQQVIFLYKWQLYGTVWLSFSKYLCSHHWFIF